MKIEEIRKNAPKNATHYLLVPNGSGNPYYFYIKNGKYYFAQCKDEFEMDHMFKHIKPL